MVAPGSGGIGGRIGEPRHPLGTPVQRLQADATQTGRADQEQNGSEAEPARAAEVEHGQKLPSHGLWR